MTKQFFKGWKDYLAIILIISILLFLIPLLLNVFFNKDIIQGIFMSYLFGISYFIILLGGLIFWVTMIIDSFQKKKWVWFIFLILTGYILSLIYYFISYKKNPKGFS